MGLLFAAYGWLVAARMLMMVLAAPYLRLLGYRLTPADCSFHDFLRSPLIYITLYYIFEYYSYIYIYIYIFVYSPHPRRLLPPRPPPVPPDSMHIMFDTARMIQQGRHEGIRRYDVRYSKGDTKASDDIMFDTARATRMYQTSRRPAPPPST